MRKRGETNTDNVVPINTQIQLSTAALCIYLSNRIIQLYKTHIFIFVDFRNSDK